MHYLLLLLTYSTEQYWVSFFNKNIIIKVYNWDILFVKIYMLSEN